MKVGLKTEVHTRVKYIKISYVERMTTPLVTYCDIRKYRNKLYQGRSRGGYSGGEPASTDDLT